MANIKEFNDPFEFSFRVGIPNFTSIEAALKYHRETIIPMQIGSGAVIPSVTQLEMDRLFYTNYQDLKTFNWFLTKLKNNSELPTLMANKLSELVGITCFCGSASNAHMWTYYGDG